jgi:hypothetical protein
MPPDGIGLDDGERPFNHTRMIPETVAERKEGGGLATFLSPTRKVACPSFLFSLLLAQSYFRFTRGHSDSGINLR